MPFPHASGERGGVRSPQGIAREGNASLGPLCVSVYVSQPRFRISLSRNKLRAAQTSSHLPWTMMDTKCLSSLHAWNMFEHFNEVAK